MINFNKILLLAPHTDDVELGCGGTIARFIEEGADVHVTAFSTARESLPEGAHPDTLKEEFIDAMTLLGIPQENIYVYDFTVRKLSYSRQEVLEELVKLRSQVEPEMVFLPSGADLHQDHQVLHQEGLRAFKDLTVWGYELPWNHISFSAQAFIRLEERHLKAKWQALSAYKSQLVKKRPYFTKEFVESLAVVRGVQIKEQYAECFEVIRTKF